MYHCQRHNAPTETHCKNCVNKNKGGCSENDKKGRNINELKKRFEKSELAKEFHTFNEFYALLIEMDEIDANGGITVEEYFNNISLSKTI